MAGSTDSVARQGPARADRHGNTPCQATCPAIHMRRLRADVTRSALRHRALSALTTSLPSRDCHRSHATRLWDRLSCFGPPACKERIVNISIYKRDTHRFLCLWIKAHCQDHFIISSGLSYGPDRKNKTPCRPRPIRLPCRRSLAGTGRFFRDRLTPSKPSDLSSASCITVVSV